MEVQMIGRESFSRKYKCTSILQKLILRDPIQILERIHKESINNVHQHLYQNNSDYR